MKILHVYAGPFPSHQGTQVFLRGLLRAQVERGDHVALRCWYGGSGAAPPGVEVRRLGALPGSGRLRSGPSLARAPLAVAMFEALRREIKSFDLVHAHLVEAPLVARLAGARPLVLHLHTTMAEELPTYAGVPAAGVVGSLLDRACVAAADGVIALSAGGAALAIRRGARLVRVVPPGVEAPDEQPAAAEARAALGLAARPWVVYCGNLDGYQDLDRLLVSGVRYRLPLLVITADSPDHLRRRHRELGGSEADLRVFVTRDYAQTRRWCAAGAVGAVPRGRCSGYPMKILTLLGLGLPVVALADAVDPHPGVVLTTEAEFGRTLSDLVDDEGRRSREGAAGLAALSRRSWSQHAIEIADFYAEIVR